MNDKTSAGSSKKRVARICPEKQSWMLELPEKWDTMTGDKRHAYIWDSTVDNGLFGDFLYEEHPETILGDAHETPAIHTAKHDCPHCKCAIEAFVSQENADVAAIITGEIHERAR